MILQSLAQELILKGDDYIRSKGVSGFHLFAENLLRESGISKSFDLEDTLRNAVKIDEQAPQNFKSFEFSDLPLTLGRGEHCFIDLYFWRRRPTTIHNHHFAGAFMGLMGKNVDLEFSFTPEQSLGDFHEMGKLEIIKERVISKGDVVAIAPLDGFIHQNHHQADLTVNLCFRTHDLPGESLSGYLFSGLKHSKSIELLMKVERLRRLVSFGSVETSSLGIDEALAFLIQNFDSGLTHPRFLELNAFCQEKVQSEARINIQELLELHWKIIEDLEEQYE